METVIRLWSVKIQRHRQRPEKKLRQRNRLKKKRKSRQRKKRKNRPKKKPKNRRKKRQKSRPKVQHLPMQVQTVKEVQQITAKMAAIPQTMLHRTVAAHTVMAHRAATVHMIMQAMMQRPMAVTTAMTRRMWQRRRRMLPSRFTWQSIPHATCVLTRTTVTTSSVSLRQVRP